MVSAKKLYLDGKNRLERNNIENASTDASYIIKKHSNKTRAELLINDVLLSEEEETAFFEDINKRLDNIPLQYILGRWEFMSLPFLINENVLIPRAETEILVEKTLEKCKDKKNILVVDLCCGSGCIAISLAHYNKNINCIGIDISKKAIDVARKNAKLNLVENQVAFKVFDILKHNCNQLKDISADIIVSNPPYIKTGDIKQLDNGIIENEPLIALDGGQDGYIFYKSIIKNYKAILKKDGFLCFECGISQSEFIKELMKLNGFWNIKIFKDYNAIDRVVIGKLK